MKTNNLNTGHPIHLRKIAKPVALCITALFIIGTLSIFTSTSVQAASTPVFGNTLIGTYLDQNDANAQSVSYFTSTTTGPVTDIIAYIDGTTTGKAIAALYAVNGGTASALLKQSSPANIGTTMTWVDFQLPTPYNVNSGTTYGLAIMGNVQLNLAAVTGTGQRDHNAVTSYAAGFANPFGIIWGTNTNGAMSIYATTTTSPTPTATPTPKPTTTPTPTPAPTPSPTLTPTPTETPTPTPTASPTPNPTPTPTPTPNPTPTPTATPKPTATPTPTPTPTATPTPTLTTFGNTAIGTYTDQNDANAQSVSYFTSTTTGPVTDIIAYIDGTTTGKAIAALYATSGGTAGTLLEQSSPANIGTTMTWVDFQLPTPYNVNSGTTYGLAIMGNIPINLVTVTGTGQRAENAVSSYAAGFANPFGIIWGTSTNGAMSIYAVDPSSPTSTSSPTATPTAASTPTPTPKPTTTPATGQNLASFPNGWYTDDTWAQVPAENVYQDTSTTYDGMYTLRVDPTSTTNQGADFWTVNCAPGEKVEIICWIKTAGTPNPATACAGAQFEIDWYGTGGSLNGWEDIGGWTPTFTQGVNSQGWVPWGSGWTEVIAQFTVPATFTAEPGYGYPVGEQVVPTHFCPCIRTFSWGPTSATQFPNNVYTAWFSDFQVYESTSG